MAFSPLPNIQGDNINTHYHQSVKQTFSDTQTRYAIDSLARFENLNTDNKTRKKVNQQIKYLTKNGTYNNNQKRTATTKNWSTKTENQSNNLEKVQNRNLEINITNLSIKTSSKLLVRSKKIATNHTIQNSKKIRNIPDPLLKSTGYSREINYCGFNSPAKRIFNQSEASKTSGTVRGKAIIEPSPLPTNQRKEKIIITLDITNYSQSNTSDFAGYFSKIEPTSPSNYNDNYTVGTSRKPEINQNQRVIIHEGLWKSHFYKAIPKNCYMPTNNKKTPSIYERINQSTRGNKKEGIYTILNPDINESDIGYERLNNNSLDMVEIKTISETGSWPQFNMSKSLAEAENLNQLIK